MVVADSGYGSEQNYEFMEAEQIEAYVKYNYFHKEQKSKGVIKPSDAFIPDHLYYNQHGDFFVCPMGQKMTKRFETHPKTKSGYQQTYSVYQAKNCNGCPLRGACHQSNTDRKIQVNWNLKRLKDTVRQKLLSDQGVAHRSQRPVDVEAVFGNIKQNKNFTRFMLRGKDNVPIEA